MHSCQTSPLHLRQSSHQHASSSVACKASPESRADAARAGVGVGIAVVLAASGLCSPAAQAAISQHTSSLPDFTPVAADIGNLAENENFWQNFIQYGRFFTSVLVSAPVALQLSSCLAPALAANCVQP